MSLSKGSSGNGTGRSQKRALPSWMSARDDGNGNGNGNDDPTSDRTGDDSQVDGTRKKALGRGKAMKDTDESGSGTRPSSAGSSSSGFSKLLDGVVFALSGFVNPERGVLRSQALEMGAEYQPDWNSNCTLLVCAFPNTPKFRQVEADNGTIVSKDWIIECYTQKKLVEIETFLMHVGEPWKKSNKSHAGNQVHESSPPSKSRKREAKQPHVEPNSSTSSKESTGDPSRSLKQTFSPSKVKKWAVDDLNETLTWLESQEEKPEPGELRNVAAEGILTCIQDAIDLLGEKQGLGPLTEQWSTVPHVVEVLIKIQCSRNSSPSCSDDDLHKVALTCKEIYEGELKETTSVSKKREEAKSDDRSKGKDRHGTTRETASNSIGYDSDDTIEMTEDEINDAYNSIASVIPT